MDRLSAYVTGYHVPARCKHCGKWHYGKSKTGRDIAERNAAQAVEACRKSREVLGLTDELTDAEFSAEVSRDCCN